MSDEQAIYMNRTYYEENLKSIRRLQTSQLTTVNLSTNIVFLFLMLYHVVYPFNKRLMYIIIAIMAFIGIWVSKFSTNHTAQKGYQYLLLIVYLLITANILFYNIRALQVKPKAVDSILVFDLCMPVVLLIISVTFFSYWIKFKNDPNMLSEGVEYEAPSGDDDKPNNSTAKQTGRNRPFYLPVIYRKLTTPSIVLMILPPCMLFLWFVGWVFKAWLYGFEWDIDTLLTPTKKRWYILTFVIFILGGGLVLLNEIYIKGKLNVKLDTETIEEEGPRADYDTLVLTFLIITSLFGILFLIYSVFNLIRSYGFSRKLGQILAYSIILGFLIMSMVINGNYGVPTTQREINEQLGPAPAFSQDLQPINPDVYIETQGCCNDGIKNGNETDIDCGGSFCEPCEEPDEISPLIV